MDLLTISKQYANVRAGLPSSSNIIPGSTTTFAGNWMVNGSLTGQNLLIGTSSTSQCAINTAGFLQMTGTTSGTMLQLTNVVSAPYTIQGQVYYNQLDYAAIGVTVGTSMDMYAWNAHNWNLLSTQSDPGFSAMQLSNYGLGIFLGGNPQAVFHVGENARIDGYGFSQSGSEALHLGGPLTILDGSNDYYRFISALDNSMSSSSRYMNIGQSTSAGNSLEIEFRYDSSNAPTNAFKFGFPGNGVMTLLNSGKVGILTSSPTATLDVAGTGRYSGSLTVGGSLTTAGMAISGTTAGTVLQLVNTTSGTTTTAYGALGVTPGTALENFALNSHRWWMGSSGTTSGIVGMQLSKSGLTVASLSSTNVFAATVTGSSLQVIGPLVISAAPAITNSSLTTSRITYGANVLHSYNAFDAVTLTFGSSSFTSSGSSRIIFPVTGTYFIQVTMQYQGAGGSTYGTYDYLDFTINDNSNTYTGYRALLNGTPTGYLNPIFLCCEVPVTSSNITGVFLGIKVGTATTNIGVYLTVTSGSVRLIQS